MESPPGLLDAAHRRIFRFDFDHQVRARPQWRRASGPRRQSPGIPQGFDGTGENLAPFLRMSDAPTKRGGGFRQSDLGTCPPAAPPERQRGTRIGSISGHLGTNCRPVRASLARVRCGRRRYCSANRLITNPGVQYPHCEPPAAAMAALRVRTVSPSRRQGFDGVNLSGRRPSAPASGNCSRFDIRCARRHRPTRTTVHAPHSLFGAAFLGARQPARPQKIEQSGLGGNAVDRSRTSVEPGGSNHPQFA